MLPATLQVQKLPWTGQRCVRSLLLLPTRWLAILSHNARDCLHFSVHRHARGHRTAIMAAARCGLDDSVDAISSTVRDCRCCRHCRLCSAVLARCFPPLLERGRLGLGLRAAGGMIFLSTGPTLRTEFISFGREREQGGLIVCRESCDYVLRGGRRVTESRQTRRLRCRSIPPFAGPARVSGGGRPRLDGPPHRGAPT